MIVVVVIVGAVILLVSGGSDELAPATPVTTQAPPTTIPPLRVDDTPKAGPVTIETAVNFAGRVQGFFNVTEGADILGCSSGTFVDTPNEVDIRRDFTCSFGTKGGTFKVVFDPDKIPGPWRILEGTGDFTALQGGGDFSMVLDPNNRASAAETWTGDIEYTS